MMMLKGQTLATSCTFATTTNQQCIVKNEYHYDEDSSNKAFSFNPATLYGNDTQLTECEVYKVEESKSMIRKYSLHFMYFTHSQTI